MTPFLYSSLAVFIISLVSLLGVFAISLKEKTLSRFIFILVSLSVGALFGDVFVHILPEIFEDSSNVSTLSIFILLGIFIFLILEKFLYWRHSHGQDEESFEMEGSHTHEVKPIGTMVILSDSLHNFIDGVIIGGSFIISLPLGVATTIAVVLHEIPQEIGDFGLLIHSGYGKRKAILYNFLSSLTSFAGLFAVFLLGDAINGQINTILAFAAGGFIYIAGSDLVPEIHKTKNIKKSAIQIVAMLIGFVLMYALLFLE